MKWIRKHLFNIILILMILIGIGLLVYPTFSDWWNKAHQSRVIMHYAETVSEFDNAEYEKLLKDAQRYNDYLATTGMQWNMPEKQIERYNGLLNVTDDGVMAYIEIPKIRCSLPIYHGTDERVLQNAIGHLEGTSLPVGGTSSHCVLSGHRGLPSARLFTDLDKMIKGDTFTIQTLNETLTYEVDQIRVVEPSDLSDLQIEEGKDYCTLVTCTPYGINTHRLLVRGHRVTTKETHRVQADAIMVDTTIAAIITVSVLLVLILLIRLLAARRRRKHG